MLKFMRTIPCAKISNLLNNILSNRFFQVFLGNQSSRWRRLNNGLPPGSALAPILFNLCMSDLPSSSLNLFQYVDDIAYQARKFEECEIHLEKGFEILSRFFHEWSLRPNLSKTEICVFHLGTAMMPTESGLSSLTTI
jgi:hypothetical protein